MAQHDEWKSIVEDQLKEGKKQFNELGRKLDDNTKATKEIAQKLEDNTATTHTIAKKLDEHITSYEQFRVSVQPAVDAIITMQAGVRAIGKIANFFGWLAQRLRKGIVWIAPVFAFFAMVWAFLTDNAAHIWRSAVGIFK